jgi:hypothetical protein
MEQKYSISLQVMNRERELVNELYQECSSLLREKEQTCIKTEINTNHLDTKNRLLKEVLTKRNNDVEDMEKGNKQLITILEKYDEKLEKVKEQL